MRLVALAQDERQKIFEETSHHIAIGIEYLPQIARRLPHSRELAEPLDFLTWFEYAPKHSDAFEELVRRLSSTKERTYVDREVDIRGLVRLLQKMEEESVPGDGARRSESRR